MNFLVVVAGGGDVGEGDDGGQRDALSTGGAGARQRIVHISTAPHAGCVLLAAWPARRLSLSR